MGLSHRQQRQLHRLRPAAGRSQARTPCTAFVLAGGAALGAMSAGMVHARYERSIAPGLLIGTSVSALNSAVPASRTATLATAEDQVGRPARRPAGQARRARRSTAVAGTSLPAFDRFDLMEAQ